MKFQNYFKAIMMFTIVIPFLSCNDSQSRKSVADIFATLSTAPVISIVGLPTKVEGRTFSIRALIQNTGMMDGKGKFRVTIDVYYPDNPGTGLANKSGFIDVPATVTIPGTNSTAGVGGVYTTDIVINDISWTGSEGIYHFVARLSAEPGTVYEPGLKVRPDDFYWAAKVK